MNPSRCSLGFLHGRHKWRGPGARAEFREMARPLHLVRRAAAARTPTARRHDWVQASSNPAISRDAPMGPPCDGKTKERPLAAMSKAPVAWRAYREFLFDRVS